LLPGTVAVHAVIWKKRVGEVSRWWGGSGVEGNNGEVAYQGLNGGRASEGEILIVRKLGQVCPRPSAEEGRRALEIGVLEEILEFRFGFLVRLVYDNEDARDEFDIIW
jgi:hypothetical protein